MEMDGISIQIFFIIKQIYFQKFDLSIFPENDKLKLIEILLTYPWSDKVVAVCNVVGCKFTRIQYSVCMCASEAMLTCILIIFLEEEEVKTGHNDKTKPLQLYICLSF